MNNRRIIALIIATVCTESTMITLLNNLPSDGSFGSGIPGWLKATLLIGAGIILYLVYDSATVPGGVRREFTAASDRKESSGK